MHISPWLIWFWLKLDMLGSFFGTLSFLIVCAIIALFFVAVFLADTATEYTQLIKSIFSSIYVKRLTAMGIFSLILYLMLPNTKQFAAIYIVPKIANSKTVTAILSEGDDAVALMIKQAKQVLLKKLGIKEVIKVKELPKVVKKEK